MITDALTTEPDIRYLKNKIGAILDLKLDYEVTFTGSALEGHIHIITSTVRRFLMKVKSLPHIIISKNDRKEVIDHLEQLRNDQLCYYTVLRTIDPDALNAIIRTSTCLISIAAVNEAGVIYDLRSLASVAHREQIPFHSDASLLAGRVDFLPNFYGVDAFTMSFHRIGGPPGVGLMAIKRTYLEGYKLYPLIKGAECKPIIAAAATSFITAMKNRSTKNERLIRIKVALIGAMNKHIKCFPHTMYAAREYKSIDGGITPPREPDWVEAPEVTKLKRSRVPFIIIVELKPRAELLPTTLILSLISPVNLNERLAEAGIVTQKITDVLISELHPDLARNLVSICMSDFTTPDELKALVQCLLT